MQGAVGRRRSRRPLDSLLKWLRRDGFDYNDGRIVSTGHVTSFPHLITVAATADLPYLLKQLERIEASINEDPWLAIGTAKEMVETICKTILTDLGKSFDKDWDLMALFQGGPQGTPAGTRRHPRPGQSRRNHQAASQQSGDHRAGARRATEPLRHGTRAGRPGQGAAPAACPPGGWCGFVARRTLLLETHRERRS